MSNHDKLGSGDIGNLALKLRVGVSVGLGLEQWWTRGKRALGAKWHGLKTQHHHFNSHMTLGQSPLLLCLSFLICKMMIGLKE